MHCLCQNAQHRRFTGAKDVIRQVTQSFILTETCSLICHFIRKTLITASIFAAILPGMRIRALATVRSCLGTGSGRMETGKPHSGIFQHLAKLATRA
jgi:hypothetical protein